MHPLEACIPIGRLGSGEEVALGNAYMTGQTVARSCRPSRWSG